MKEIELNWEEMRSYKATVQVPDNASHELITTLCDQMVHSHVRTFQMCEAGPAAIGPVQWREKDGRMFGGRIR